MSRDERRAKPVVFLAFANEQEGRRYLRDLPEESRQLQSIMQDAEDRGLYELVVRTNATLDQIDEVFRRHGSRVAIFHFAGHADADRLLLESASGAPAAHAEGLAGYLGGQGGVKLVFLNGCSTRPQVAELLRKGIDVVVATARPIDDAAARAFAVDFYKQLVAGRTFRDAFEKARELAKTARGNHPRAFFRDLAAFGPEDVADERGFPWDFQVRPGAERTGRTSLADLAGDPLLGLPALPPGGYLPPKPYPEPLQRFTVREAYVFFGRGQAIRELYDLVTSPTSRPAILYTGPTGVGKSSVLDAGLRPRLATSHRVIYLHRNADLGLLETLVHGLSPDPKHPAGDLCVAWREAEDAGRPLAVILDQAEGAFTRPRAVAPPAGTDAAAVLRRAWVDPPREVAELVGAVRALFLDASRAPRGRLILGFRKEWLQEFERPHDEVGLGYERMLLGPLDRAGIVEAIEGPTRDPDLQRHYRLTVEPGLANAISTALEADAGSALAPTLQVLLTKLWQRAGGPGGTFTRALYDRLYDEGILLQDVLDNGLKALKDWNSDAVESGLALDVLAYHTTDQATGETRSLADLRARYAHRADVLDGLLGRCKEQYLLIEADAGTDLASPIPATRLAHDTLAPLVLDRFRKSGAPGQRARRLLENRAPEWVNPDGSPKNGAVLDEIDLKTVRQGQSGMRGLEKDEPALLAASLVEVIRVAETKNVLPLVKQLVGRDLSTKEKEIFSRMKSDGDPKESLHASLVLLREDDGQVEYLYHRLLEASPTELPVIRDALKPYQERLVEPLWSVLEQPKDEGQYLQAASALAVYEQSNLRWKKVGGKVAQAMVKVNDVYLRDWLDALRSARGELTAPLATIFRDKKHSETERSLAMNILVDYGSDQPTLLADLLMDAEGNHFAVLFDKLKTHQDLAVRPLEDELAKPAPAATGVDDQDVERKKDVLAERQARAAVALIRLGKAEEVWHLMRHSADPRLRSFLVNWLRPLGADHQTLAAELRRLDPNSKPMPAHGQKAMDAILFHLQTSMRRALILALGKYGTEGLSPGEREPLIGQLLDLYRNDPDAGIHGAAQWTLRKWGQQEKLKEPDAELMKVKDWGERRWFVNGQGQTFAVIHGPVEFLMGSPLTESERPFYETEGPHRQIIPRRFAIAAKVVTRKQYERFVQTNLQFGLDPINKRNLNHYSPDEDCPVICVSWYGAAAYCNWLSEQEGLPKDQWCYLPTEGGEYALEIGGGDVGVEVWCYLPTEGGEYAEGITIPADVLQRTGYRLPTEAEWEYACRAGTITSRYYGNSVDLLKAYAWYQANSQEHAWPCGSLLPNDLGLFDMLGNVHEWCQGRVEKYQPGEENFVTDVISKLEYLNEKYPRILRGAGFNFRAANARSGVRTSWQLPSEMNIALGFRPARTCPDSRKQAPKELSVI